MRKEGRPSNFFCLSIFQVHMLWDSKYKGSDEKKIPVFVTKFGELFLISLCVLFFFPFIIF